jgi:hypothetical protein
VKAGRATTATAAGEGVAGSVTPEVGMLGGGAGAVVGVVGVVQSNAGSDGVAPAALSSA